MASDTNPNKLGLALSGGGFRASYFHIGVLAQMADQGLLRHVEVISTVSGGSIIGALYYLHVKNLLETKTDNQITNQDYMNLVEKIEKTFKEATDHNIRMSTFADLKSNLRFRKQEYSRSDRISTLYNDLIYYGVLQDVSNPVQMRELKIFPLIAPGTWDKSFSPRSGNAPRKAKVPMLVINATSLNTGRAWQFTAQSMGEPIAHDANGNPVYEETDSKPIRLRYARPSYNDIVERQQGFSLGHAVGASACVPGLFPPLSISDLYPDIRVQLVDGGVFDNQGIESLQFEQCTHYVVSDASGQIAIENEPQTGAFPVLVRASDSIFPDRVRTESLQKLFSQRGRGNIAFMHLRKGLEVREIPWNAPDGNPAGGDPAAPPIPAKTSAYGVAPQVQELLSKIRTDLDAFSEVEAFSLMLDGSLMSEQELSALAASATGPQTQKQQGAWGFKTIAPWINNPGEDSDYLRQLEVASYLFGKVLFLIPWLSALAAVAVLLLLAALWPWLPSLLESSIPTLLIIMILLAVLARKFAPRLEKIYKLFKILRAPAEIGYRLAVIVGPCLLGTGFVQLYLKLINPLFLKRGSVAELKRREPRS